MKTIPISNFIYEELTGRIYFEIESAQVTNPINSLYLINRDVPKYAPERKILIPFKESQNTGIDVDFNLNGLIDSHELTNSQSWYLICEDINKERYGLALTANDFNYHRLENHGLFKVKPYLTKYNSVAFYISHVDVHVTAYGVDYINGILKGELELLTELEDFGQINVEIGIRDRRDSSIQVFDNLSNMITVDENKKRKFEIPLAEKLNNLGNEYIYDVVTVLKNNADKIVQRIMVGSESTHKFDYYKSEVNNFYLIKVYKSKENSLAIYCKRQNIIPIISDVMFDIETGQLGIEGYLSNLNENTTFKAVSYVLKQRNPVGRIGTYFVEREIALDITGDIFATFCSLEEAFPVTQTYEGTVWDVFIRIKNDEGLTEDYNTKMVDYYVSKNYDYYSFKAISKKVKPYITGSDSLGLYVMNDIKATNFNTKVALLGTCFSRNPFNSMPYFNPEYKNLYQVVFSQFHSSLISLTSDPVEFSEDDIGELEERFVPFVKRDFSKSFFDDLKESSPDYFILDLDIDAIHNLVKISESQIVTLTYMLAKTNYLKNNQNYVEYITHENDEVYFDLWRKAADTFINKLIKIVPPERIILTAGRYAEKYYNKERKVSHFPNLKYIRDRNRLWERMDYYFLSKLPQARYINLTNTGFIGDESYPFGNKAEPSHYESKYYKEFLKQLNQIVLEDCMKNLN